MKFRFFLSLLCLGLLAMPARAENSDFYHQTPVFNLLPTTLKVDGEVKNPGAVDLSNYPQHSVVVKETLFDKKGAKFIGAYRYDGVSLFDILKDRLPKKSNAKEFDSVIDLLLVVENAKHERVVLSWGEVFYPPVQHRILLATKVSPIIPSKTKEEWPIPVSAKLVFANDLFTERNLSAPVRITVLSAPHHFKRTKKLFQTDFRIYQNGKLAGRVVRLPSTELRTYPSVFFGRGKGFHGMEQFKGVLLKDALKRLYPATPERLKHSFFTVAGADGYRVAISFAELFNRNDDEEFLLYDKGNSKDGGRFSLFPAADFFSDRAVKAVSEVHLDQIK